MFYPALPGFYRVLLGFTGFYRVLPSLATRDGPRDRRRVRPPVRSPALSVDHFKKKTNKKLISRKKKKKEQLQTKTSIRFNPPAFDIDIQRFRRSNCCASDRTVDQKQNTKKKNKPNQTKQKQKKTEPTPRGFYRVLPRFQPRSGAQRPF